MSDLATLQEGDGTWTLRFERRFDHAIATVWRAVAEAEHRDVWFPQRIEGELVVGGALRFVGDPNLPPAGLPGRCVMVEPPYLLELEWGDDRLRIELSPDGDGTRMVLVDTLAERRHAARSASGWHVHLDILAASLDGREPEEMSEARWTGLHDRYLDTVGGDRHVWGQTPA